MGTRSRISGETQPVPAGEGRRPSGTHKPLPSLVASSPDPAALFDAEGRVLAVNDAATAIGAAGPAAGEPAKGSFLPFWADETGRERLIRAASSASDHDIEVRFPAPEGLAERVFWVVVKS